MPKKIKIRSRQGQTVKLPKGGKVDAEIKPPKK